MIRKFEKNDLSDHLKTIETMADQTAVHRKKFEYALSIFRKFVDEFKSDTSIPNKDEAIDDAISYFRKMLKIINQNLIQTWTLPTIENPPCYVMEQLQNLFSGFQASFSKYDEKYSEILEPDLEKWKQYNILDLRAISASFTQYLKTPGINDQIYDKVKYRLESIDKYLEENATDSLAPRVFSPIPMHYQSWLVNYDDFTEIKEIGRGVSAHVFRGLDKRTNEEVAIKKFTFQKLNSSKFQSYQREVAVLATAQHPALLRLIGATDKSPFCIITEWMNGGTLYHAIHKPGYFSPTERTIAAYDIARGMDFLHSRKIVHRDLKTLNVLLDNNKRVKICDFGFSRFAENDTLMSSHIGTPHWMAPEVLKRGSRYTSKVDVYAYGIVLWELATSETPYATMDPPQIVQAVINSDLRPPLPQDINPQLKDLMTLCWDRDPNVRPSFDEIVNAFKAGLIFDGTDEEESRKYIKINETEGEQLATKLTKMFKDLTENNTTIQNVLQTVQRTGLPHNIIEQAWNSINSYVPKEENEYDSYTKLLVYFLNTSKLGNVSEKLMKMPAKSIPLDIISKFVVELPTGSPEIDRNICIAACKNKAADLCSLYASSLSDIALSLEIISLEGVDYQLRVIVIDKCVQSLSSKSIQVIQAALRCLLSLGEAKRIPLQFLEKNLQSDDQTLESLSQAALINCSEQGNQIPNSILAIEIEKAKNNDPMSALLLISAASDDVSASFILNKINDIEITKENSEIFARILLRVCIHNKYKTQVQTLLNNKRCFDDSLISQVNSILS